MNVYCLLSKSPQVTAAQAVANTEAESNTLHSKEGFISPNPCTKSSEEPDVVIVVGGKEFYEYRQVIRCWSGYFDAALRSGMEESKTRRFEFPDRKPEEWVWIVSLLGPMTKTRLTMDTLPIALDWFDMLCSPCGLAACDQLLSQSYLSKLVGNDCCTAHLPAIVGYLGTSMQLGLEQSKKKCFLILQYALIRCVAWFAANKDTLEQITSLAKEYAECFEQLWSVLKMYVPPSICEEKLKVLLQANLLHEFIFLEMNLRSMLSKSLREERPPEVRDLTDESNGTNHAVAGER